VELAKEYHGFSWHATKSRHQDVALIKPGSMGICQLVVCLQSCFDQQLSNGPVVRPPEDDHAVTRVLTRAVSAHADDQGVSCGSWLVGAVEVFVLDRHGLTGSPVA
jgi:hypothetical protein